MKISVVVPVYNVEKYLNKCVTSIINQTHDNLEIILVDDGSTDKSGKLCEDLKAMDHRIKVIHKINGGLSSARNVGLDIVTGDYVGFIDSDDWVEPDFFQILKQGIDEYKADIAVVHFEKVRDFSKIAYMTSTQQKWTSFTKHSAMKTLFNSNLIGYSAVNKLYHTELFNDIRFPEGMLMEDKATTYKLIHKVDFVVVNTSKKYHYFLREDSIIRRKFNRKNFDSFKIHEEIIDFMDSNYPNLSNLIRAKYVYTAIRMLLVMASSNYSQSEDIECCVGIIQKYVKYALNEKEIRLMVKLLAVIVSSVPYSAKVLTKSRVASKFIQKVSIS